jgi:hypothetical protein
MYPKEQTGDSFRNSSMVRLLKMFSKEEIKSLLYADNIMARRYLLDKIRELEETR